MEIQETRPLPANFPLARPYEPMATTMEIAELCASSSANLGNMTKHAYMQPDLLTGGAIEHLERLTIEVPLRIVGRERLRAAPADRYLPAGKMMQS